MLKRQDRPLFGALLAVAAALALNAILVSSDTLPKQPGTQAQAYQETQGGTRHDEPEKGWTGIWRDPMSVFTGAIALLTLVLAVSTVLLWLDTRKTANAALISANAARRANKLNRDIFVASERPWIKMDIAVDDDLAFHPKGVLGQFKITLENVGKSPARAVVAEVALSLLSETMPPAMLTQLTISTRLRKRSEDEMRVIGYTIFPGQTVTFRAPARLSAVELAQGHIGSTKAIIPFVVGVADYLFINEPGHHQTRLVRYLHRAKPGARGFIGIVSGENVPLEELMLNDFSHGSYAD